jgi:crotonobetainyl-CoA:carnitine CoA-transferase CaiB-like acyl-CoA transferase
VFGGLTYAQATDRLTEAQTAFGAINSVHDLIGHPQLRTKAMTVNGRRAEIPAAPYRTEWDDDAFAPAPGLGLGEHR